LRAVDAVFRSCRDGGAELRVSINRLYDVRDGMIAVRERNLNSGHGGGLLLPLHIGLGDAPEVRRRINWPGQAGWSDWITAPVNAAYIRTRNAENQTAPPIR
jgi:hypothetical protein